MYFEFHHKPISKNRPRFGRHGCVYDPQKAKLRECQSQAEQQMALQSSEMALESPIECEMVFYIPMPVSWSKKRRKTLLNKRVVSRPDGSNYFKWYEDVLNKIAYDDDRYISDGKFKKIWAEEGRVEISIQPILED